MALRARPKIELPDELDFSNPDLYQHWIKELTVPLYDPNIRYIFFVGGAGSAKSHTLTQLSLQAALRGEEWYWLRKIASTLKDSCIKKHKEVIDDMKINELFDCYEFTIKNFANEKDVRFLGLDDPEKIKSIVSPHVIVMEEGSEFDFDDFTQLDIRLRGKENQKIIILSNKISTKSWIKKLVYDNPLWSWDKTAWIEKTVLDNRFIDESYINALKRLEFTNKAKYDVYFKNNWGEIPKGLVYKEFQTFKHNIIPQAIGLDFGWNDPHALTYLRLEDQEGYIQKALFVEQMIYERNFTIAQLIDKMEEIGVPKDIVIVADNARPEAIQQIGEAGYIIIPAKKGANSIKEGVDKLNQYRLFFNGKELIEEGETYSYAMNKSNEPTDAFKRGNDHCCDSFRYGEQAFEQIYIEDESSEKIEEVGGHFIDF